MLRAPPRTARHTAGLAVVLGGLSAFGPLSMDMYLPGLPQLGRDLDASASVVQFTLTACIAGLALGQLVAGPLSDRFGRRRPLLAGVTLYILASLLCAVAPSAGTLVALRFVQGLAGAAGIVVGRAVVRDLFDGDAAARLFASLLAVNALAPVLAPLIGGQVLTFTTWRGVFGVLAGIGVVLLVTVICTLPESLPEERRRPGGIASVVRALREVLTDRVFVGYAACGSCAYGAMFAYIAGSPFVLQEIHGFSPQAFSAAFAVNGLGIATAALASRRLVGHVSSHTLIRGSVMVAAVGASLLAVAVAFEQLGHWPVIVALFLVVAPLGMIAPNVAALALARHGAVAGSAAALLGAAQFLIGALAAPLVGIAGSGSAVPMAVLIALLVTGAATALRLTPTPSLVPRL
jgi:DHA1 family bicyclomycin/chloramphenicol resistance-like MFS transporter